MNSSEVVDEHGWGSPVAWPRVPIRSLTRTLFVDGDWIESPYITDSGVRLIQTGNIGIGHYKEQGLRYVSDETFDELRCTEVLPGDVLICRLADPVGRACVAPDFGVRMITSVDVTIVRPKPGVLAEYVALILSTERWLQRLSAMSQGGTRDRIARLKLGELRVPLPDLETQRRIVDVLDAETTRMDTLIEKNERVLELLAVRETRILEDGIYGSTASVVGIHYLASYVNGYPFKPEDRSDEGTPIIRIAQLLGDTRQQDYYAGSPDPYCHISSGDLIFSWSATLAAKIWDGGPAFLNQHLFRVRPHDGTEPRWLLHALNAAVPRMKSMTHGSTMTHITRPMMTQVKVPKPSLVEQQRIAIEIDTQFGKVAALRAKVDRQQELLRLRRQALITAAVTGQIDV